MLQNNASHYLASIEDFKLFLTARIIIEIKERGYCDLEVTSTPNLLFKDLLTIFGLPNSLLPLNTHMVVTLDDIKLNNEDFHLKNKNK